MPEISENSHMETKNNYQWIVSVDTVILLHEYTVKPVNQDT